VGCPITKTPARPPKRAIVAQQAYCIVQRSNAWCSNQFSGYAVMRRNLPRILTVALLLTLIVSCHPEGCYGPKAFGYNTKGVAASNLFGIYTFDGFNASVLDKKGFTNHSGYIQLKSDMTFVFSEIPCIMNVPRSGVYFSTAGKWRIVPSNAIWEVEVYDVDSTKMGGYATLAFPIVGESPPHGIELAINDSEGYWIRFQRNRKSPSADSPPP
jgi:hypothetical protein